MSASGSAITQAPWRIANAVQVKESANQRRAAGNPPNERIRSTRMTAVFDAIGK
jgi:hypothetical protein